MENYMMVDGKKLPISDETITSIRNSFKQISLEDVLRSRKQGYFISEDSNIIYTKVEEPIKYYNNNIVATEQRAKQLQAITLLMIVADYFNRGAEVHVDGLNTKYVISYLTHDNIIRTDNYTYNNHASVYFEREKDAEEAIRILGFDTIKLALTGH